MSASCCNPDIAQCIRNTVAAEVPRDLWKPSLSSSPSRATNYNREVPRHGAPVFWHDDVRA